MIYENETFICDTEVQPSSSQLVPYNENLIQDISLNKNFDLSSMPSNYMRKRSKIEEIIYQAVFNQNNHKSPFASFKIANDCIPDLNKIDIVTGTNNLKKVMKSLYENSEQISIMVHKIGTTWLMDDFDIDALFLGNQYYADWSWLRDFIARDGMQLAKADLSRASLARRDLYAKFLYHSANQLSIQLPEKNDENCSQVDYISQLPISKSSSECKVGSKYSSRNNRYDHHREDYINLVDWKLNDLSFVVGSDLSIFGTKSHPCISLRLHPCQEPINILTGIDMWFENLLNEVPEVAMCYHDQGIVMREYEIFRTDDIPQISGFNKDEVESIAKNLSHFLSTNATKEGHTYWLFKETDSTMVKLYDLTDIWMKNQQKRSQNNVNGRQTPDGNPFILPVAVLCFKLAENRIKQWHWARNKRGKSNLTSSQFNNELLENKMADDKYYFNDIFRLLKNCINLLIRTDKNQDLINKAIILMCQLYLEVDQITLNNLRHQQEAESTDTVLFDLNDLKGIDKVNSSAPFRTSQINFDSNDDSDLIGTQLYELCVKNSADELFVKTLSILDSCDVGRNEISFTNEELLLRSTLLADSEKSAEGKEIRTVANTMIVVKDDLFDSVLKYHERLCLAPDISKCSVDELQNVVKSGFLVLLFDGDIWSGQMILKRDINLYCNVVSAFISRDDNGDGTEVRSTANILTKMDTKLINYYCIKRNVKYIDVISLFQSIFMSENKRLSHCVEDRIHKSSHDIILYLVRLSNELLRSNLIKLKRISIQRGIPILVNDLVKVIVILYQHESTKQNDQSNKETLKQWCLETIFPVIDWISYWTELNDFKANIEDILMALVWANKSKLYRLCLAIFDDIDYFYYAIESYSKAIESFAYINKKKIPPMYLGLKGDRLDLCMQLLERVYGGLKKDPEDTNDTILDMQKAMELCDRIFRAETAYQGYEPVKARYMGLRLRMNYVRYYLNLKAGMTLNYDQILSDFQNDMRLISTEKESLSKCKESLLIMFYLTKIEADRLEILSIPSLESFLKVNTKFLNDILSVKSYRPYLENDGESTLKEIQRILVNIVKKLLSKCYNDSHRRKKVQRNRSSLQDFDNYLNQVKQNGSICEETEDLLKAIQQFI